MGGMAEEGRGGGGRRGERGRLKGRTEVEREKKEEARVEEKRADEEGEGRKGKGGGGKREGGWKGREESG